MIQFLIDADLPRSACTALRQRGYRADDVRDLDLGAATDETVLHNEAGKGDHRHYYENREEPYRFIDVETLVRDFVADVAAARRTDL